MTRLGTVMPSLDKPVTSLGVLRIAVKKPWKIIIFFRNAAGVPGIQRDY
jgi:hypothetical protein